MTRREALRGFGAFVASSPLLEAQFAKREDHRRAPSLDEIANVLEFEPVAKAKIPQAAYDYVAGSVEDEVSLRRNRKAFDWVRLLPKRMAGVAHVDLSTQILGQPMKAPLLVAPTAGHLQLHPSGEMGTHRGATAAGVTMAVSHVSSQPFADVAKAADGPLWSQLYIHRNVVGAQERVIAAEAAGAKAIVWTVDGQFRSLRERLDHNANLSEASLQRSRRGTPASRTGPYGLRYESPDETWEFLQTIRSWTSLPVLIKGLLTADDALLAIDAGADAIVVSNHGARYASNDPATIEVLPEIVDAVGGRIPILIDGGFRRGEDILKALAIGADAVQVGRPPLWGLGAFGAAGVERVLTLLQAELAAAMASCGCAKLADISRRILSV